MYNTQTKKFLRLSEWTKAHFAPIDFLQVAIGMVRAIEQYHKKSGVHKDVQPKNFLISPQTHEVKLFGLTSTNRLRQQTPSPFNTSLLEGTLAYMSPEQTGRMNRPLDYRSDYYSLGVTLYEMLTGQLPFHAHSATEWIHCHIARVPEPPLKLRPDIPQPLSHIVMKLLEKEPDHRYQSAAGLLADLNQCLDELSKSGRIAEFEPGRLDTSAVFRIPTRMYGRENETRELLQHFASVIRKGQPEFVLVTGYAGIGKTALVGQLQRPVSEARGFFVSGKFDQYRRDVPYSTLLSACEGLVQSILSQSEEQVLEWRSRILEAVGAAGQLLVDVLPQLELVLGPQPPVPESPLSEAQQRFNRMFQLFLSVFARPEHPLVIFLDDLHWADQASLGLLDALLCTERHACLLIIGAYRDNEVSPSHPLMLTLEHLRKNHTIVNTIVLHPLCRKNVCEMLVDLLRMPPMRLQTLTDLIYEKTAGNPFFAIRFVYDLHHAGLLRFDANAQTWQWDRAQIEAHGYTDNVIDLMTISFCRMLPTITIEMLKLAACVGYSVDVDTLSLITAKPVAEVEEAMQDAADDGFVVRQGNRYRFAHDRIQQAAYLLIREDARPPLHLRIGRLLLGCLTKAQIESRLFEIAPHFNQALDLIQDEEERLRVAELNLTAGSQAKASAAYSSATIYFEAGLTLLGEQRWRSDYPLMFALTRGLAECKWLSGHFEAAHREVDGLFDHAGTTIDQAIVHQLKGDLYQTEGDVNAAVAVTIQALALFDIDISSHPDWDQVLTEFSRVWELVGERDTEELLYLPMMTDANMQTAMASLSSLYAPAYFTDANLATLVACKMVSLSLQFGTHEASPMGYAAFGRILAPGFDRYQDGYRFGKLGYDLIDRLRRVAYKARIADLFGISTTFWVQPFSVGLEYAHVSYRSAIAVGDLTYACYACMHIPLFMLIKGEPLEEVQQEAERRFDYVSKAGYEEVADIITAIQRTVACLRGTTRSMSTLADAEFDQEHFEEHLTKNRSSLTMSWYKVLKSIVAVYALQFDRAAEITNATESLLSNTQLLYPEHFFHRALALAGSHDSASPAQQKVMLEVLEGYADKLKTWAHHNPANYGNKYALVAAELARIRGNVTEAQRYYNEAVATAQTSGFLHNEALGCERAARFYRHLNLGTVAEGYLNRALICYQQWGAWGKVKQLYLQHPQLSGQELAPTARILARPEYFDVLSISAASQAISREMDWGPLQETLMRILIEYSAAEQVRLFLAQDQGFLLQANARVDAGPVEIQTGMAEALDQLTDLPHAILNYTIRSHEKVLLDDAATHRVFGSDPYIRACAAKSILCLPILRGEELLGMLLLENRLVTGLFSPAQLVVLELLAAQAAISLQNASLYTTQRKSQLELQSIIDNAAAVISTKDLAGRYLLVNRQFEKLFQASSEQIVGKTDNDLFPDSYASQIQRDDQHVISTRRAQTGEQSLPFDDKTRTYLSVKFPLQTQTGEVYAVCDISTDISDRKSNEIALFEQKERAQVTLQSIGDAVITTDAQGRIDYLNPVAQHLTGWALEKALGQPLTDVLTLVDEQNERPLPNPLSQVFSEGKTHRLSGSLLIRRDGTRSVVEDSAAPIRGRDGSIVGAVVVFHDVSESRKISAQLAYQATHDALTGLPNRVLLEDRLEQAIASAKLHGHGVGVLFLDLDHFKKINDSLGHTAGDLLLKQIVMRLKAVTHIDATISRQGGDEFIILIPNLTHRSNLADLAELILHTVSSPYFVEGHELPMTFSIGISVSPYDGTDAETLIKNADAAMYHAKAAGRDNFQFYAQAMNKKAIKRLSLEASLRSALTHREFEVFYQPKIGVATGELVGAEALLRWNHPRHGLIGPKKFIAIAEECGLIVPMGLWVAEEVCRQGRDWLDQSTICVPIAVNLSAIQFKNKSLADALKSILESSGLPSHLLAMELTESAIMDSTDRAMKVLGKLKDLGLSLSIDDFGTGYSSLSYLKRFPIDTLKIDQAFVRDVARNDDDAAIIRAIIRMGHSLRLTVVAEGVETEEQYEFLKNQKCDEIQGYYFSKPLPASKFEKFLKRGVLDPVE